MDVIRKSAKFLSEGNPLSEKTGKYEPLAKEETTDSDTDVSENVLFEQRMVKTGNRNCRRLNPKLCWIACIVLGLLALAALVIYCTHNNTLAKFFKTPLVKKPQPNKTSEVKKRFKKTPEWKIVIDGYSTQSCIRLVDVDEDGRDDVIFGMLDSTFGDAQKITSLEQMKKTCADKNQSFPCAARVVALRGYDGKELWRMRVRAAPFMINCHKIDIDGDGKADCIASGRNGTVVAFDPRKGKVLWDVDQTIVHQTLNFYNVLILSDFTGDGVPEVLLSHGGDPKIKGSRYSGRLALVDGSNGRSLGRILKMRLYKETHFSPVLHTTKDGSQYVLYGEGGKKVKGAFLGISVPDLFRYVKNLPRPTPVPNTRGNYTSWEKRKWYHRKHGVFVIYKSKIKGVMVSPTLVDMNKDGVRDIMMSAFDGFIRLYDGDTLEVMWTTRFRAFETYSCFAPAYFNDDDTLDFMTHLNRGAWPHYKHSLKVVLDGRNGRVLWYMNATFHGMTSDLVMRTTDKHRDAFVFRIEGVNGPVKFGEADPKQKRLFGTYMAETNKNVNPHTDEDTHFDSVEGPHLDSTGNYTTSHNMTDDDRTFADLYKESFNDIGLNYSNFRNGGDDNWEGEEAKEEEEEESRAANRKRAHHRASCNDDQESYVTQFMVLDRSNVHAPNVLYQLRSIKYFFNLTEEDKKYINDRISLGRKDRPKRSKRRFIETISGPYCIVLQNDERATGVLGDVDGDGELDQVAIIGSEGRFYSQMIYKVTILKINAVDAIKTRGRYRSKLDLYVSEEMRNVRGIKPLQEMEFRPLTRQPWTQFMGKTGEGIYRRNG